ncbi:protein downstream neighbor of son homolog [Microplitis demolitor]|uniref:protein downstream neighbor of son homolog n=1 Tax=Microplitis demolitor TaxID=69319 RepID=UPI0004CC9E95|nr:protein downstream neighbor of son homolog [Microplitis demolitor]XP_053593433.1 protein downstream neighbor of son homolog [Microplitis demolitor]
MTDTKPVDPPEWIHPDQIMEMHRLKVKKRALQARMNRSKVDHDKPSLNISIEKSPSKLDSPLSQKRKNPFLKNDSIKRSREEVTPELDASCDSVLFELMKLKPPESKKVFVPNEDSSSNLSFSSVLSKLELHERVPEPEIPKGEPYIPMDWTLNTKMRFMSPKPFAWNGKLKTSEQASGTTGFVRCLDTGEQETTLDTSPNARFHQCCLVWQHPSLPWLDLYPRSAGKVSASLASNSAVSNNQFIKDALFSEWSESFRSLFHLLRAGQCPYFYVCANTFTVLFRAAGICGISEVHALLTPTTRGFRQSLKQQDIEYTMPLRMGGKRRSDVTDSGCDTFDSTTYNPEDVNPDYNTDDNDDDDAKDNLLESLGIEDSEIKRINKFQKRIVMEKESEVDTSKQSLIFVKGVEAQALFNFLINCKSAIAITGALAGVPPTLLAPVAFHGATLKPLKVRESIVRIENDKFHSLEINGPILPHVLPSLCFLMRSSQLEKFSVSCAQLSSTKSFTDAKHGSESSSEDKENENKPQSVFGKENLSDCGLTGELLSHFCNSDRARIKVVESLKYSSEGYTWS